MSRIKLLWFTLSCTAALERHQAQPHHIAQVTAAVDGEAALDFPVLADRKAEEKAKNQASFRTDATPGEVRPEEALRTPLAEVEAEANGVKEHRITQVDENDKGEPVEKLVVRNGTPPEKIAKSLAQLEQTAESYLEATVGGMSAANPFFCFGRVAGGICSCLAAIAIFNYIGRACFGEKSCWYTWPCCKKIRLALKLDEVPSIMLNTTVHRARDLGAGQQIFIAILPRRGKSGRAKPKLNKGTSASTAPTADLKWEQHLQVQVEQGCDILQICAFKKARMSKGGTLVGWDNIKITDLMNKDMEPVSRKWIYLSNDEGSPVGSVNITIQPPAVEDKKGKKTKSGSSRQQEQQEDTSMPNVSGMSEEEALDVYAKSLSGPLNQANKLGEYNLRYFKIEQKRDVFIWAWYKEKNPAPGAKPQGRIPLLSISTIYEVPHSISEFIVRYRDATDRPVDMMLQRHERPREWWVKTLHSMLALLRDKRKRKKAEGRGTLDVPSSRAKKSDHSHSGLSSDDRERSTPRGGSSGGGRQRSDQSGGNWSDSNSDVSQLTPR